MVKSRDNTCGTEFDEPAAEGYVRVFGEGPDSPEESLFGKADDTSNREPGVFSLGSAILLDKEEGVYNNAAGVAMPLSLSLRDVLSGMAKGVHAFGSRTLMATCLDITRLSSGIVNTNPIPIDLVMVHAIIEEQSLGVTISDDLVMSAEELHASSLMGPCGLLLTWWDMFGDGNSDGC